MAGFKIDNATRFSPSHCHAQNPRPPKPCPLAVPTPGSCLRACRSDLDERVWDTGRREWRRAARLGQTLVRESEHKEIDNVTNCKGQFSWRTRVEGRRWLSTVWSSCFACFCFHKEEVTVTKEKNFGKKTVCSRMHSCWASYQSSAEETQIIVNNTLLIYQLDQMSIGQQ